MKSLGEIRIRLLRVLAYANFVTFISATLAALKIYGFRGYWIFALLPILALIAWVDHKYVIESENDYLNKKNRALQELLDRARKNEPKG
jgi:hypothetical protein